MNFMQIIRIIRNSDDMLRFACIDLKVDKNRP